MAEFTVVGLEVDPKDLSLGPRLVTGVRGPQGPTTEKEKLVER